jgi:hypothetical protein
MHKNANGKLGQFAIQKRVLVQFNMMPKINKNLCAMAGKRRKMIAEESLKGAL